MVRREGRRWATVEEVTAGRGARRWVGATVVATEAAATTAATARAAAAATAAAGRGPATASARRAAAATTRTRRARARARAAAAAAATRRRRRPRDLNPSPPRRARSSSSPTTTRFLSLFTRRDRPLSTSVSGGTLRHALVLNSPGDPPVRVVEEGVLELSSSARVASPRPEAARGGLHTRRRRRRGVEPEGARCGPDRRLMPLDVPFGGAARVTTLNF